MPRKKLTIQDKIIKNRLDNCPHCGVGIVRHLVYPDSEQCVYTQDVEWLELNSKLDTNSLSVRKGEQNEIPVGE